MTQVSPKVPERNYGCTFGCGNPYDFVFISVRDGTTEFLCLPCMVRLAVQMVESVQTPDSPIVQDALRDFPVADLTADSTTIAKPRGKHAPATTDDDDLIEAFSGVITEDELPDEFR
jgi:hypothetical protein